MNSADLWPIVKAHAEGKKIQFREDKTNNWELTCDPRWDPECEYRIAPEPKVRPWTMDEVPIGRVAIHKTCKAKALITGVGRDGRVYLGDWNGPPEVILDLWVMDDGSPCGVICE